MTASERGCNHKRDRDGNPKVQAVCSSGDGDDGDGLDNVSEENEDENSGPGASSTSDGASREMRLAEAKLRTKVRGAFGSPLHVKKFGPSVGQVRFVPSSEPNQEGDLGIESHWLVSIRLAKLPEKSTRGCPVNDCELRRRHFKRKNIDRYALQLRVYPQGKCEWSCAHHRRDPADAVPLERALWTVEVDKQERVTAVVFPGKSACPRWVARINEDWVFVRQSDGKRSFVDTNAMRQHRNEDGQIVTTRPFCSCSLEAFSLRLEHMRLELPQAPAAGSLYKAWLASGFARTVREVVFDPTPMGALPDVYNLWRGFPHTPRPGDCSLFLVRGGRRLPVLGPTLLVTELCARGDCGVRPRDVRLDPLVAGIPDAASGHSNGRCARDARRCRRRQGRLREPRW
ncbi:Hypothetical protein UVM_LOCUS312 [uncultured virus]|nr:Hypothetical protein UVM_LOCUS312 [uncultured virus]